MIRFGTAGWRGIIGEDFTFQNVRLVTQAIANILHRRATRPPSLVVGYDTRFLSEKFAVEAAKVLSHNRIKALVCQRDCPTPALAHLVSSGGHSGGLNFTVSHNPPEYNGLKFSDVNGAPALPQLTARVEEEVRALEVDFHDEHFLNPDYYSEIDATSSYLDRVRSHVDLDLIAASGMRFGIDVLYGTGRECLDRIMVETGTACKVLHNFRDPYFGGYGPDLTPKALAELSLCVGTTPCSLGLATDIDADRFAIIDSDGTILNPNDGLGLLLDYTLSDRGQRGDVARTVATTHLVDRIADAHGVKTYETPVGFKYIGDLIRQGQVVMGGEESAGISIRDHLPEKDGILACLLAAELAARRGVPLAAQLEDLWRRVGRSFHVRHDYKLTPVIEVEVEERLDTAPSRLAGQEVRDVVDVDGIKLILDDSWFLYRRSGTEALLRCYAEAPSVEEAEALHAAGREYLFGSLEAEMV
jgi:alpha-D-glucose phosphate-specific phosphoglucomutase